MITNYNSIIHNFPTSNQFKVTIKQNWQPKLVRILSDMTKCGIFEK